MTTVTQAHPKGEDLMAFLDGELTGPAFRTVQEHVASCELCAAEIETLRSEARTLSSWTIDELPHQVEGNVLAHAKKWNAQPAAPALWALRPRQQWIWGGTAALTASAFTLALVLTNGTPSSPQLRTDAESAGATASSTNAERLKRESPGPASAPPDYYNKAMARSAATDPLRSRDAAPPMAVMAAKMPPPPAQASLSARTRSTIATDPQTTAPMIARTVALTLIVKDVERSRQSLEELLRTYNGYAAQMELSTPEAGRRTLRASLRIPAGQMRGLLAELKGYGKVANETQSGEEVGQQHADLLARLNTARESEERLRAILKNRTGDVADVLQVEQEIARVRTEIERMEAQQQGLEHRVTYATVELQMSEEGQGPASPAVSSRLGAAARQGWDNATETVLGFITFLLQYGLALAFILALVGVPAWLAVKWWRKQHPNS